MAEESFIAATDAPDEASWPDVDVVLPVRNEADHLGDAVAAVLAQDYPGSVSVVLAVAPSTDGTQAVAQSQTSDPRVRIIANPRGTTPAGLNAAIKAGTAPVVARVDGHSLLPPGYIRRAVATLRRTGAVNVGGIQRAMGVTPFERAVADAMTSKFGTGDAAFHYGGDEGPTDTVYLGVFDRRALEAAGLYDERLLRNQDYELNIRLRGMGGLVWFDPALEVTYRPRGSLRALAKQYSDYGRWKRVVIAEHPGSLRRRQAIPPATTVAVAASVVAGLVWRPALIVAGAYFLAVIAAASTAGRSFERRLRLLAIFPTMHFSWGTGFLVGTPSARREVS